jgi:hypothetical protein
MYRDDDMTHLILPIRPSFSSAKHPIEIGYNIAKYSTSEHDNILVTTIVKSVVWVYTLPIE